MFKFIDKYRVVILNNKSVIENYFFMTILQVLNSFFYLLIYPYLIRVLGIEYYGKFVFTTSIITYFIFFINFGFDLPATKFIAQNLNNHSSIERVVSNIFTAKILLFLISLLIVFILPVFFDFVNRNFTLFIICFSQTLFYVIFPQWFFQAIQKMKIVTCIQLTLKVLSLPFIFFLIKSKEQLELYAFIVSASSIIGSLIAFYIVRVKFRIVIHLSPLSELYNWFKESIPFFLSNSAGVIKEQSITLIIGSYFGMKEVAIYDLANKIISIPKTLFTSVNAAIFPKIINSISSEKVKQIIRLEYFISILVILLVLALGKFAVLLLGGKDMLAAYPLAVILSFTIMIWLVVGAYISFIFVPNNKYFFATKNQVVALFSFLLFGLVGLLIIKDVMVLCLAIVLSGFCEILYCKWITHKEGLI